jgi:hypothetical protein
VDCERDVVLPLRPQCSSNSPRSEPQISQYWDASKHWIVSATPCCISDPSVPQIHHGQNLRSHSRDLLLGGALWDWATEWICLDFSSVSALKLPVVVVVVSLRSVNDWEAILVLKNADVNREAYCYQHHYYPSTSCDFLYNPTPI